MLTATTHRSSRLLGAALAAVLGAGCAISPKPEPPLEPSPVVDLSQVETIPSDGFGPWLVAGGPGAASPVGAEIHVTNLETELDPVVGLVAEDGSFEIEILAEAADEVRLQLVTSAGRSAPADFVVGVHNGSVFPPERPLGDCFTLSPAAELDTANETSILVHNGCSAPLQIAAPSLRRAVAGLTVAPASGWPAELAVGESLTLSVSFTAPADAFEEIVFVATAAAPIDRRPITLWPATP